LLHGEGGLLRCEDGIKGASEDAEENNANNNGSKESLRCRKMPVFPDDVGRLACIVHVDDRAKECAVMRVVLLENSIVVEFAPALSFFCFKGQEAVDRRLHLI
jgi:hypothetical protein